MHVAMEKSRPMSNRVGLQVGGLGADFVDGELRRLRLGSIEIVRRVFVGVRDRSWGSAPGVVSHVSVAGDGEQQSISFSVHHDCGDIAFDWDGRIELVCPADANEIDATVRFEMDGRARKSFQTNRTGICVLHPLASCAGKPLQIAHSDGSKATTEFPKLVRPDAVASDIAELGYEPTPGLHVSIGFEGEVFETEDQRNWADGSYKTYCPPLSRRFPYELKAGDRVWQRVVVRVKGRVPDPSASDIVTLTIGPAAAKFSGIGLSQGVGDAPIPDLSPLAISHLRVEVRLRSEDWRALLRESAEQARLLAVPVELVVHLLATGPAAIAELCAVAVELNIRIIRWLIHRDGQPVISRGEYDTVTAAIQSIVPDAAVGYGTIGSFAELNRRRPAENVPLLAWSVCPQVHATDNDTLVESLEGIASAVAAARSFAPNARLALGPVCFWRTPDPFAAGNNGAIRPPDPDGRLSTHLGAAWTLGCISALAQAGVDSISLYQTTGAMGVVDGAIGSLLSKLLRQIGEFARGQVLECKSSDPTRAVGLAIRHNGRQRIWTASLATGATEIRVEGPSGEIAMHFDGIEVRCLDLEDAR